MFDPHRVGYNRQSYRYQRKGQVLQKKLPPKMHHVWTRDELIAMIPILEKNGLIDNSSTPPDPEPDPEPDPNPPVPLPTEYANTLMITLRTVNPDQAYNARGIVSINTTKGINMRVHFSFRYSLLCFWFPNVEDPIQNSLSLNHIFFYDLSPDRRYLYLDIHIVFSCPRKYDGKILQTFPEDDDTLKAFNISIESPDTCPWTSDKHPRYVHTNISHRDPDFDFTTFADLYYWFHADDTSLWNVIKDNPESNFSLATTRQTSSTVTQIGDYVVSQMPYMFSANLTYHNVLDPQQRWIGNSGIYYHQTLILEYTLFPLYLKYIVQEE